jgi:hypothetical protein
VAPGRALPCLRTFDNSAATTRQLTDLFERQRIENARLSGQIVALEMAVKLLFIQHPESAAPGAFYSKAIDGLLEALRSQPLQRS